MGLRDNAPNGAEGADDKAKEQVSDRAEKKRLKAERRAEKARARLERAHLNDVAEDVIHNFRV